MKPVLAEKLKALALALAVSAPMSYVLQISMGIWLPAWYALAFSAVWLVVLELIGWNRGTAIAVPVGVVLLCAALWVMFGKAQRQAVTDYYWWAVGFLYNGGEYTVGNAVFLTALSTLVVTLYAWLFGRKLFFFPAMLLLVVGFVLFKWLQGLDAVLLPGLLAVGGLIALWAKAIQRKTAKRAGQKSNENGIALFLLPISVAIVLLSLVLVPAEQAAKWQNRQVYDLFERINNYLADYTDFNRPRHTFSIAQYGFMPMGNRLGGPTELSDAEVLVVSAPRQMLLRGTIYNDYTGNRWTDTTGSQPFRLNSAAEALRDNAFDRIRPELSGDAADDFSRYAEPVTLHVYPLLNGASTLFVPFRGLVDISSDKFLAVLPRINAKGEAFSSSDVRAGYGYTVTADSLLYTSGGFAEQMDALLAMGLTDSDEQADTIRENYLSLPQYIKPWVYEITNRIAAGQTLTFDAKPNSGNTISVVDENRKTIIVDGGVVTKTTVEIMVSGKLQTFIINESDEHIKGETLSIMSFIAASAQGAGTAKPPENKYRLALAIEKFLKDNYKYTLSPSTPPEDEDFVSYFLGEDRQGYCTYFATSMAVMARIAGIPSRYVEGYALPAKGSGETDYTVRGKNAHAWAELYFEGIGWIPFDATPSGNTPGEYTGGDPGQPDMPMPTPPIEGPGDDGSVDLPDDDSLTWDEIVPYLWMLPAGAASLMLLWIVTMMIRAKARVSLGRVRRKFKDPGHRCAFYYFDLLNMLEYYNYPVKKGETPNAYAVRIDRWLRLSTGSLAQVADLISRISYSDYSASDADVRFMADFRRELAKYTYQTVGPWFYLWRQVLGFKRRPRPESR